MIVSRCDSLVDCKSKLETDYQTCTNNNNNLERELNLIKPDLLKLYRRRENIQQELINKYGISADIVRKVLEETRLFNDDHHRVTSTTTCNNSSSTDDKIVATKKKSTDYIPPDGAFEDTKGYLLEGYTKQDAMNLLTNKRDGTFLIRPSETRPGYFALSLICKSRVHNCLIECRNGQYGFAGAEALFGSLVEFVQHYSYNSLKDHNCELDTTLRHPVLLEQS